MPGDVSALLEKQVFEILKQTFGPENALLLMEYWAQRMPLDVARRRDVEEVRLEIEKVRAELIAQIEQVRAELTAQIEQVRAELTAQIEQVRAELTAQIEQVRAEIEKVRADLAREIEKVRVEGQVERERLRADLLKWSFVFWATQMLAIGGVLFSLVQLMRSLP